MTRLRRLLPGPPASVDVAQAIEQAERPVASERPWVAAVLIASADGATSISGRSGGLGGRADRATLQAHRHMADLILVGAATVKSERYGPPAFPVDVRERRRRRGQDEVPRIAAVSGSLSFSFDEAVFDPASRAMVVAPETVDPAARDRASGRAELLLAGHGRVDLAAALVELRRRGVQRVICEGGPHLLGSLMAADLVDELGLTVAPMLVGGSASRIAAGGPEAPQALRLDQVLEDDGYLMLRYLRDRAQTA